MQHITHDSPEVEKEPTGSAPVLAFLAALSYRRAHPAMVAFLCLLLAIPFLLMVFLAPSLFVTDQPMEVLSIWLEARSIIVEPPSLTAAAEALAKGSFLYLMLVNAGALLGGTPGESLLAAQGLMAVILLLPLAYGSAMRLPVLPAIFLTLFIMLLTLAPPDGVLAAQATCSLAVFLWLSLITYAPPHRSMLTCAQAEGFLAGLGLWFLYMTATPLFLAGFAGFTVALVLQERRGLIFTLMALATFLVLGASADLLAYMTLGVSLVGARLGEFGLGAVMPTAGLPELLAAVLILLGFIMRQQSTALQVFFISLLVALGSAALIVSGMHILPVLLLAAILAVFGRTNSGERYGIAEMTRSSLSGVLSPSLIAGMLLTAELSASGGKLLHQYQQPPLRERASFGFSFADTPQYADLILNRRLDPALFSGSMALKPADQAVLLAAGLDLAEEISAGDKPVALVGAGEMALLSASEIQQVERAQIVIAPKLAIDPLTDAARVNSQRILYTEYRRAPRMEQVSPVYDIWVRR